MRLADVERAHTLITRLRMLVVKRAVTLESLDLNEVVRETVYFLSSELQRNRVILRTEFAGDLPRVRGDRVQLQQVVLNLLPNSLEAMSDVEDRSRNLRVRTQRYNGMQVCVTVSDTGRGFPPTDAATLFGALYTTKGKGRDIGLFINRLIVESHRGRLWAAPNEGQGATFSFSIPQDQEMT